MFVRCRIPKRRFIFHPAEQAIDLLQFHFSMIQYDIYDIGKHGKVNGAIR